MTSPILSNKRSSLLRSILRVGLLLGTTFGLRLSVEQVVAIQTAGEVVLTALVQWNES